MPFRVLSIDGGGMRGIYSATVLSALEKSFKEKRNIPEGLDIGKAFQLIVGTSTGAIIGCGLAHGVPPETMADLYVKNGAAIFPLKMPTSPWQVWQQRKTRSESLEAGDVALAAALKEVFGSTTVLDIWKSRGIALVIPSVNMLNYRSWVFKTPHELKSDHRDDGYTLVDVCRASSAAPLYRSLAAIPKPSDPSCSDVFCDGGLWANNPVLVALTEALKMVGNQDDEIEIFCLGSCGKPEGTVIAAKEVNRGLFEWKFGGEAAVVSLAAQEFAFDMMAKFLIPHLNKKVRIVRFPTETIPAAIIKYLNLDETSEEGLRALKQQANNDANMINSHIRDGNERGSMIENLFIDMPARSIAKGE